MTILLVAIGGFLGANCRYIVGKTFNKKNDFPYHTLVANISGSLLLGIVAGLHVTGVVSEAVWTFLGVGFLGAYTTMSTFGYETFSLIKVRKIRAAVYYILATISLGLFAVYIGLRLTVY